MSEGQYLEHDWFPRPLPTNIVVGERSWIYSSFAFLHYRSERLCGLSIGHDCGLYNGTFFNLGLRGEVKIGNYTTLVGAIISSNYRIVIGHYVFIAHEVMLADSANAVPPQEPTPVDASRNTDLGPRETRIVLGDNCWIGARAVLLSGATIGEGAIVGAGAVVNFEVPPYAIVAGNPARVVGWAHEEKSP